MTCYVCLSQTGGWNMQHDQSGDHLRFVHALLMPQGAHRKPLPAGLAFNLLHHESSLSLDLARSIFYLFLLSALLSALHLSSCVFVSLNHMVSLGSNHMMLDRIGRAPAAPLSMWTLSCRKTWILSFMKACGLRQTCIFQLFTITGNEFPVWRCRFFDFVFTARNKLFLYLPPIWCSSTRISHRFDAITRRKKNEKRVQCRDAWPWKGHRT